MRTPSRSSRSGSGGRRTVLASDAAEIVRICGYLPLAVELVASRLLSRPSWTTSDLLKQLTSGMEHLSEMRDGERTLSHVFGLSYRALTPVQQLVFRQVGLHFGVQFGTHAVAALADLSFEETERALEELQAHHLISEPSPHRFTVHDLLREYARTLSDHTGDSDSASGGEVEGASEQALRRLVDHYVRVADRADRLAYPFRCRIVVDADGGGHSATREPEIADAQAAEQWLITEGANLLRALDWTRRYGSEAELALHTHVLAGFLDLEGHLEVAEPLLRRAVAHWRAVGDDGARARALLDLGAVCAHSGQYDEGYAMAREALGIARSLKDEDLESEAVHQLSIPLWHTGQYVLAQTLQERSLDLRLRSNDRLQVARSLNLLGITHLHLGQNQVALEYFLRAFAGFTDAGDDRGRYRTLNNLAELQQQMGNLEAAERAYREAIEVSETMGSRGDRATLWMNLASVLTPRRKTDEALALYARALPVLRGVGDVRGEGIALMRHRQGVPDDWSQ